MQVHHHRAATGVPDRQQPGLQRRPAPRGQRRGCHRLQREHRHRQRTGEPHPGCQRGGRVLLRPDRSQRGRPERLHAHPRHRRPAEGNAGRPRGRRPANSAAATLANPDDLGTLGTLGNGTVSRDSETLARNGANFYKFTLNDQKEVKIRVYEEDSSSHNNRDLEIVNVNGYKQFKHDTEGGGEHEIRWKVLGAAPSTSSTAKTAE